MLLRRGSSPSATRSGPWFLKAAAAGTARMNVKLAEAVTLAKIAGEVDVDLALGPAAASPAATSPRS
jgi:hypothetical protein